jgi:two-component sensor histidine kinase
MSDIGSSLEQMDQRAKLLAGEMNHRAQNLMAMVLATVQLTEAETVEEFKQTIVGRIHALAHANSLLARSRWAATDLRHLVEEVLAPYRGPDEGRARISGPDLVLEPSAAQSMALAMHELATNAVKYGALSAAAGRVEIGWSHPMGGRLAVGWTETGGPPVKPPTRRGFGTAMVKQLMSLQLEGDVQFEWRMEGLACKIAFPAKHVSAVGQMAAFLARHGGIDPPRSTPETFPGQLNAAPLPGAR